MGHRLHQPQNANTLSVDQLDNQNGGNQLDWHKLEEGWKIPKGVLASLWR